MTKTAQKSFSKVTTIMLFSLVLIVALLVFMPTKAVLWAFPIEALDTRQALIKGTWWNGSIRYGSVQGITLDEIRWYWSPAPLSGQGFNWQVYWQDNLTQGEAQIAWPFLGETSVQVTDLQMRLDVAYLPMDQISQFGLLAIYGQVNIQADILALPSSHEPLQTPRQLLKAITLPAPVILKTTDIYVESILNNSQLTYEKVVSQGSAKLAQGSQLGSLLMEFGFPADPLAIDGVLEVHTDQLSWRANIKPHSTSPAWIDNVLLLFATPGVQNQYTLRGELAL